MTTRTLKEKLQSRKLWALIAAVVTAIAMHFGAEPGMISDLTSAALVLVSVVVYIITEGKIDAAGVAQAAQAVADAAKALDDGEE